MLGPPTQASQVVMFASREPRCGVPTVTSRPRRGAPLRSASLAMTADATSPPMEKATIETLRAPCWAAEAPTRSVMLEASSSTVLKNEGYCTTSATKPAARAASRSGNILLVLPPYPWSITTRWSPCCLLVPTAFVKAARAAE